MMRIYCDRCGAEQKRTDLLRLSWAPLDMVMATGNLAMCAWCLEDVIQYAGLTKWKLQRDIPPIPPRSIVYEQMRKARDLVSHVYGDIGDKGDSSCDPHCLACALDVFLEPQR